MSTIARIKADDWGRNKTESRTGGVRKRREETSSRGGKKKEALHLRVGGGSEENRMQEKL